MLKKFFLILLATTVLFAPLSAIAGSVKSATSHHCRMNNTMADKNGEHEKECHECAGCDQDGGQCQNNDCGMASCTVTQSPVPLSTSPAPSLLNQLAESRTPHPFCLSTRNEPPLLRPPIYPAV